MPADLLKELAHAGMSLSLAPGGRRLLVQPASRLTDAQRGKIRSHCVELIAYLSAAGETARDLIEASLVACEHHRDGPEARAQMVEDVLAVPEAQRQELLEHFREVYGRRRRGVQDPAHPGMPKDSARTR